MPPAPTPIYVYIKSQVDTYIAGRAPVASPAFTGTPTTPAPASPTDSSTQIANTAFVQNAINTAVAAALAAATTPGDVKMIAGSTASSGWLLCDGSAVSRTTYANLYATIGTSYGAGDGSTTFNLPNLQGKVPVGYQSGDANFGLVGQTGGEKTHLLTIAELASHNHIQDAHGHGASTDNQGAHSHTGNTGGVGDHYHYNQSDNQGYHAHNFTTSTNGDHNHSASTLDGFMTYQTTNATRQRMAAGTTSSSYAIATRASQINDIGYGTTNNNGNHSHTGSTDGQGGHVHYFNSNNAGAHSHSISSDGGHTHTVTINTTIGTNQVTGSDTPHNNLQPYVVMNYVIKY